jgi:hypothetical protein
VSDIVSVRVPRELKEKMKKYNIDWSREMRRFIEDRIRVLEFLEMLKAIEKKAGRRRVKVGSVRLIREMREEH